MQQISSSQFHIAHKRGSELHWKKIFVLTSSKLHAKPL